MPSLYDSNDHLSQNKFIIYVSINYLDGNWITASSA